MGLNYNYLLYFKRDRLLDVLLGLGEICDTEGMKKTIIRFTDHDLLLPLESSWREDTIIPGDKTEMKFAISMVFDEDEAILEYLRNRDGDQFDRSPPDEKVAGKVAIGYIYLTVYTDLSKHYAFTQPSELVLFEFGTTGTKMSLLFFDSTSIRRRFINLLDRYDGVIGILDLEVDSGQLFWFRGEELDRTIESNFMLPEEIEESLKRGS